jgi:hypothetical protein
MRYELSPNVTPEEERAIIAALEEYFGTNRVRPSPWALAGRAEGLGLGALQIRFQSDRPWGEIRLNKYTRRGADPRIGRADSR